MAYGLSFSPEFFWGEDSPKKTDRPTNVADALASMSDEEWNDMAEEVFGVSGDMLNIDTVMAKIEETDTCGDLRSPVDVWIDPEGFFRVDVYDEEPKGKYEDKDKADDEWRKYQEELRNYTNENLEDNEWQESIKNKNKKRLSKLQPAVDYLKLAVWDEPAIRKDKFSEPMSLPESLGGPSEMTSKDEKNLGEPERDRRHRRERPENRGRRPRRERPERRRMNEEDCPRVAFPFNNEDKNIREEGKVTENLPMVIEKLYVVEQENKKKR